jgi:hypothetical protein
VACYESPQSRPPAKLLPQNATALGVTIDELFGRGAKRRLVKQEGEGGCAGALRARAPCAKKPSDSLSDRLKSAVAPSDSTR